MSWKDFCFDVAGKILDGRVTAQHLDALLTGKEINRHVCLVCGTQLTVPARQRRHYAACDACYWRIDAQEG